MIFGPTPLADAVGAILAHTQRLPGRVIKKGTRLDEAAVAALAAAGHDPVIAARLEPGDIGEDPAAARLAAALGAKGVTASGAKTGRVNLSATEPGLLQIDTATLDALNALDEGITVGTLPAGTVVAAGEMVATIKIIPFAVAGDTLARAEALAGASPCLAVHPFTPRRVGLVLSTLPGLKRSILDGTIEATRARVEGLGGTLLEARVCAHTTEAIAAELAALLVQAPDILLVAGASAVVDRRDVGPAGIVAAGGAIDHFGMPVDPGNLICLGHIGARPALVLPGCARSPRPNGIDMVLARLFAGQPVTGAQIARMGVGGLLKDTPTRGLPRARAVPAPSRQVAAIVLAAGASSRMAPRNKLLIAMPDGRPMLAHVVDTVLASRARPVIVVTGHQHQEIAAALAGRQVRIIHAPDHASGQSASLRAGLRALPPEAAAALVCLGDMPLITAPLLDRLIAAWNPDAGRTIVRPVHAGAAGNPVLWDRRHFAEIATLSGDQGARALLHAHADQIAEVETASDAVLRDFDTPQALADLTT